MARVTALLFILGFLWAPVAWVPVIYLFDDVPWNERHLFSLAALVGYGVWFGWGWYCLCGRFPLVSTRQFWAISLATHLVFLTVVLDDARLWGLRPSFFSLWITSNVIVALWGLLPESRSNRIVERIVRALCYGLIIAMAVGAAWSIDSFPGMSAMVLLMAASALFVMARGEPQQADSERP